MRQINSGYVYVIGNVGRGVVKIGYACDVARRLGELTTSYVPAGVEAGALTALRMYESQRARSLESALHISFSKARLPRQGFTFSRRQGAEGWTEWFNLGRHALTLIDHRVSWLLAEWARLERRDVA